MRMRSHLLRSRGLKKLCR